MKRLTLTDFIVLIVALASANLLVIKLVRFVHEVHARQEAYEQLVSCQQQVDWYVAAEVIEENERETATNACVYCPGSTSRACKYWLDRLS